jgi:hypothetical protein
MQGGEDQPQDIHKKAEHGPRGLAFGVFSH